MPAPRTPHRHTPIAGADTYRPAPRRHRTLPLHHMNFTARRAIEHDIRFRTSTARLPFLATSAPLASPFDLTRSSPGTSFELQFQPLQVQVPAAVWLEAI